MILLVAVAFASEEPRDFRGHIDQARFFIRKEWYGDALGELESAVALPDGRLDPEAWYLLAQVRYELADLEGARHAAQRAHSYARDDAQLQIAAGFEGFLDEQFGVVDVRGPYEGLQTRLSIELESVLFDPNLKLYLAKVQDQNRKRILVPRRVGLPAGNYRINGVQVTVPPGGEVRLDLDPERLGTKGFTAAQLAQAEVGMGVGGWFGPNVANLTPALTLQVAYSQPVGPFVGGLMLDWTPQGFEVVGGAHETSTSAWSLGGRLGGVLPHRGHLTVRPSVGYRFGYVPGIALGCGAPGPEDGDLWACGAGQPEELVIYSVGRAHVPMAELAVDWLERKGTTSIGVGVKAVAEQAFGSLPARAQAATPEGAPVPYAVTGSRAWTATGVRLLANLSLAF